MSKADEALIDVRRWLCDNLSDGDAGKVCGMLSVVSRHINELEAKNDKLRKRIERLQPTDSDGNVLDIADTVHMLRSEYDGDHEWDDVIVELTLTKWGGDRWIIRGSKGEAWACDCTKTGYDEDAYEASDDVEPFDDDTLAESENAKLRAERDEWHRVAVSKQDIIDHMRDARTDNAKLRELCIDMVSHLREAERIHGDELLPDGYITSMHELGIEVPE